MDEVTIDEESLQKSIITPNACLMFVREGDQWSHSVDFEDPTAYFPFARSVEQGPSLADAAIVTCPTFQEITIQRDADGGVSALTVGLYGCHHFSGVFRVTYDDSDGGQVTWIEIDIAHRSRQTIQSLASAYRVRAPRLSLARLKEGLMWVFGLDNQSAGGFLSIPFSGVNAALIEAEEDGRTGYRATATAPLTGETFSHRYAYMWSLNTGGPASIE